MLFHSTKVDFSLGKFGHVTLALLWATRCVVMIQLRTLSLALSIIRSCKTHFLWLSSLCKCININGVMVIYTCWIPVLRDNSWILDGKCPLHICKNCFDNECIFLNISYLWILIKCLIGFEIIMVSLVWNMHILVVLIPLSSLGDLSLPTLPPSSLSYFGKCKDPKCSRTLTVLSRRLLLLGRVRIVL